VRRPVGYASRSEEEFCKLVIDEREENGPNTNDLTKLRVRLMVANKRQGNRIDDMQGKVDALVMAIHEQRIVID
jgi:hypothetical protein